MSFTDVLHTEIAKRRTFGIISHPDAGKTTLTEKLLLFGGAIQMAGAVKAKKASREHFQPAAVFIQGLLAHRDVSTKSSYKRDFSAKASRAFLYPGNTSSTAGIRVFRI